MKKILLLFAFASMVYNPIFSQNTEKKMAKLSPQTQQFLVSINKTRAHVRSEKYVYSEIGQTTFLSALIKTDVNIDELGIKALGAMVGTKAGDIWTVRIPINKVRAFTLLEGIRYIQLDEPISPNMEAAKIKTRVDSVHQGIGISHPYSGKDVVVGILDVGFDYTHPTLYDTLGNSYRVKRVWEQKSEGTPPEGYTYGHEITDMQDMLDAETDNEGASHGMHVAGIAAGSGNGGPNPTAYRGMAYESDLVLVGITPTPDQWTSAGMSDIIDGMNYVYTYAESQGKPAIVNLSWGCSIGPNDGTSLFSQACDNLTGTGKIFTISAGNNGTDKIHLQKQFSATDTLVQSFIDFSPYLDEEKTWLDIWGEVDETFCVQVRLYSGSGEGEKIDYMCLNDMSVDTFLLADNGDTCFFNITTRETDYNGKPHAILDFYNKSDNKVCIGVKGTSGIVNMWLGFVQASSGIYAQFYTNNFPWAEEGDTYMILGEMACAKSAITVGAYASKTGFTNIQGQYNSYTSYVLVNRIVPFSSKGPTADNRMKPDIVAPGLTLASSVNSFDASYAPGGGNYDNSVYKYTDPANSRDYYYAEASGTSMSSPVTAGVVALMLEANPDLTPAQVKELMYSSAILDQFTTDTPDPDVWGAGKLNAYGVLKEITVSVPEYVNVENLEVYPNPAKDQISFDSEGLKEIVITDILGHVCLEVSTTKSNISVADLASGLYLIHLKSLEDHKTYIAKLIKL